MIKITTEHIKPNPEAFTKEQLKYLDYERMDETLTRFEFPTIKDKGDGLIMEEKFYKFFSLFLKQQYKLPVKYLEPDFDACSYITQKAVIIGNTKKITDASVTIEPLNQNVFKQISYTPINQAFDIGAVVSLHETVQYTNQDGTTPERRLLTSASLNCPPLQTKEFTFNDKTYKVSYTGLCNRCIPYTAIDIGSEIIGKFIIKTTNLRESMTLYKFRRPKDNILEIITPDYLNVGIDYVLDLTEENIKQQDYAQDDKKEFSEIIKMMRKQ